MASTTNYKKMARSLKQENTTLKGQITAQKTAYSTLEETASENEKHMKTLFKDYKNKTCHEIDQLKEDLASAEEVQGQMNDLLTTLNKETGAENPEDLVKWVEERAIEYADEKTHHDAVRMFGELQVKYNLLTEEMNAYKEKIAPKQAKKQKGLSGPLLCCLVGKWTWSAVLPPLGQARRGQNNSPL